MPELDAQTLEAWMQLALREAQRALRRDEVPVGAVVLSPTGKIIGAGHNRKQAHGDPTEHAEIMALRLAARSAGTWHLDDHFLVSTLEPCAMCFGAALQSRIGTIVYGAPEHKFGVLGSITDLRDLPFNHKIDVYDGILAEQTASIMGAFFRSKRSQP